MTTRALSKGVTKVFSFHHPVNVVAGMVVLLSSAIIILDLPELLFVLVYGFLACVLNGPTLSPMGQLATRALVPLLGNPVRLVAGPPKRFARAVGLGFSTASLILYYAFGLTQAAYGVLGVLILFATLESAAGFCAGCMVFGYLMRWGLVPKETCEKCSNLSLARA